MYASSILKEQEFDRSIIELAADPLPEEP